MTPLSQSDSEVRLQMPAHDNGYAVIALSNLNGVVRREYLYVPPRFDELRPGEITTVAGVGRYAHANGPATQAMVNPTGCDFDDAGNTYFADPNANRIYVVHSDGTIETLAGTGFPTAPPGDGGPAVDACISFPHNIALDGAGNMYVPDANDRIRKIDANGIITTIAGTGTRGYSGDGGPAVLAKIANPSWIAANREDVFFIDSDNLRLRKIHLADGIITTIAGDGVAGFSGDGGPATAARFNEASPDDGGLVLDGAGNLYLLDARNSRVRRIDLKSSIITTALAVNDRRGNYLGTFALDPQGNFYYSSGQYITKASPSGAVLAVWGHTDNTQGFTEDSANAATALYAQINYVRIDHTGNIVFDDSSVGRLRRINIATGLLETIAGMGPAIYAENGPATAAVLNTSDGADIDIAPSGEILIADTWNARIRRLDTSGNLTTIAGNGMVDGPLDGAGATNTGVVPLAIHADENGIDVVPFGKVVRLDSKGVFHAVTRFIGGGICQYSGDGGKVIDAGVCQPWDTARDRAGNLYIADTNNNRIRRVDAATGIISTIAGNGGPVNGFERYGHGTFCGDGGPAINACLNTPYGLVVDNEGNIFITEYHWRLRKIDRNGTLSTYATEFNATKLRIDAAGSVFGVGGGRVMRIDRSGVTTTLAGLGVDGFSGDGGPARSANITGWGESQGLAIDREGNLFFIDTANYRVRAIRYGAVLAPPDVTITAAADGTSMTATVRHPDGKPAPSVRVDFTAPASGASCILSSPYAITDANGVAAVSWTSNCVPGTYTVTARPLTAPAVATVSVTNAPRPCRRRAVAH